nr:MAG TPA: hypothetical protein [Caudoviricetes sp.]
MKLFRVGTTNRPLIERLFSILLGGFIVTPLYEVVKNQISYLRSYAQRSVID